MSLITRQSKGTPLTIEELDNNLLYLESLGVVGNIERINRKIIIQRPNGQVSEIVADNNLPIVTKTVFGEGENSFTVYKGILNYDLDSPTTTIPLKYNTDNNTLVDINAEYGKSYYFYGRLFSSLDNIYNESNLNGYLISNINYNPANPFYLIVNAVTIIELQSDGKLILGGNVFNLNGTEFNNKYIIRLNQDGSVDNTFNIGTSFNNTTIEIKIQPDGKILVGGQFTSYNGAIANRIIRLNSDGSVDNTFNTGSGFEQRVFSIEQQPDGKILVGGDFISYSGATRNCIIRLNSDGTIDNTFNIGSGFDNQVRMIKLQPDGKILVGGWFTSYNGTIANRIIRLNSDGSIDNTFTTGDGFDNTVRAIELQPDGKILMSGAFVLYNGALSNRIIRLNSDGTIDGTFNTGNGFSSNNVRAIKLQPDGKILVAGGFNSYNNDFSKRFFVRLNSDGSIDNTFAVTSQDINNGYVQAVAINSDGKIFASGWNGFYQFSPNGISTMGVPKFSEKLRLSATKDNKLELSINASDSVILDFEIIETTYKN